MIDQIKETKALVSLVAEEYTEVEDKAWSKTK